MTVVSSNLIQGPATLWIGAFGVTEPATVATAPGAGWTELGGTKDGIMLGVKDEHAVLEVDQIIYEVARRLTKRVVTIKTVLAEATLVNLGLALNNTAPAASVLTADDGLTAFAPSYGAILLDGIAPGGFRRRVILRKTLATEGVESAYKKDGQTLFPVTWSAHWVSASIAPFIVTDATV